MVAIAVAILKKLAIKKEIKEKICDIPQITRTAGAKAMKEIEVEKTHWSIHSHLIWVHKTLSIFFSSATNICSRTLEFLTTFIFIYTQFRFCFFFSFLLSVGLHRWKCFPSTFHIDNFNGDFNFGMFFLQLTQSQNLLHWKWSSVSTNNWRIKLCWWVGEKKSICLCLSSARTVNFEDEVIMTKSFPLTVFISIRNYYGFTGEIQKWITHKFGDNTNYIAERMNGVCVWLAGREFSQPFKRHRQ